MELYEKKISGETVYSGKIIQVDVDRILLPNGRTSTREVVRHPGGVGIICLDERGYVPMVRQYRYAFGCELLEIPAGKREKGEEPLLTAKRELKEETGLEAGEWIDLGSIIASPGCYNEVLYLYMAQNIKKGDQHLDQDEFLNVEWFSMDDLYKMVMDGTIRDGKTVISVLKAIEHLR